MTTVKLPTIEIQISLASPVNLSFKLKIPLFQHIPMGEDDGNLRFEVGKVKVGMVTPFWFTVMASKIISAKTEWIGEAKIIDPKTEQVISNINNRGEAEWLEPPPEDDN